VFDTLTGRLTDAFGALRGVKKLSAADIEQTGRRIRSALLEADVALPVVRDLVSAVTAKAALAVPSPALTAEQQVVKIVHDELVTVLGGDTVQLHLPAHRTAVVMLAGLQGAGKTTFAGKLAHRLARAGHRPLLVAADLDRPNAVGQLQVMAGRAGVDVFAPEPGNGVGDPVQVAAAARTYAGAHGHDVVIVDTAGRLGSDTTLMTQAAAVQDVLDPDEVLFVLDAMTGQDAAATAATFADMLGVTGVVLTKLDGDARGGAALSTRQLTGRPVMFVGTGEGIGDLELFHPDRMASRILGMGDVLTLIEHAELAYDGNEQASLAAKLSGQAEFTLDDFLEQLMMLRRMGPLSSVVGLLPGLGGLKDALARVSEADVDRTAALIRSMTPAERANPQLLTASRLERIAAGAGRPVEQVAALVEQFAAAKTMMADMAAQSGLVNRSSKAHRKSKGHGKKKRR